MIIVENRIYHIGEFDSRINVGVVTAANPLVKYLKRMGLNVHYITFDNLPKIKGLKVYKFISSLNQYFPRIKLTRYLRNLWAIRAIQELDKEAMLHIHSFTLLPQLLQSQVIPKKVLLTFYGGHFGIVDVFGNTNPYYLRTILNIPDVIIIDDFDRGMLLEKVHAHFPDYEEVIKKKMVKFPFLGVDEEVFNSKNRTPHLWYKQNIHKDGLVIFKGGSIEAVKGDSLLIEIAERILSRRKDIYFVWGGYFRSYPRDEQAALRAEMESLCKKYPGNAFYMGKYENNQLPSLLKGADVIPHFHMKKVSCISTFGREALMMGNYMLISNIGWYRDFLGESKGIRFFEWDDDEKIVKNALDELIYLADNLEETRKKGPENRKYALKYCSANISAQQHKMIYEALANDEAMPTTEELLSIAQKVGE